ncbi:hypothetical protein PV326_011119 [Microctonus aethiopoides]|nr:hypothetical protein PV326_011119 [Microctonus aethiopoides]
MSLNSFWLPIVDIPAMVAGLVCPLLVTCVVGSISCLFLRSTRSPKCAKKSAPIIAVDVSATRMMSDGLSGCEMEDLGMMEITDPESISTKTSMVVASFSVAGLTAASHGSRSRPASVVVALVVACGSF